MPLNLRENQTPKCDLAALLIEAARLCADDAEAALPTAHEIAARALGAGPCAIFSCCEGRLECVAGDDSPDMRAVAETLAAGHRTGAKSEGADLPFWGQTLTAGNALLGVWVAEKPERRSDEWASVTTALTPFFVLCLRQARWRQEVDRAQAQVERRIREVATVYEVGQAMDKVEIDRLLDMITERATQVMEAQACSLLLRLPDANSLVIAASYGLEDEVVENTRIFIGQGIAGQVAATGRAAAPERPGRRSRASKDTSSVPDISSSICMPMKDEERPGPGRPVHPPPRAVAAVHATTTCACSASSRRRSSLAVNNAQLYAKLNHKLQELSTLAALTETISSTLDLDQVLNQVADNIVDVVHFDRCRIYLADMDTGAFTPRIVRGFPWNRDDGEPSIDPQLGEGVVELVARRQTPILVDDVSDDAARSARLRRRRWAWTRSMPSRSSRAGAASASWSSATPARTARSRPPASSCFPRSSTRPASPSKTPASMPARSGAMPN